MEVVFDNDAVNIRLSNPMQLTIWELSTNIETLKKSKDLNGDWSQLCQTNNKFFKMVS